MSEKDAGPNHLIPNGSEPPTEQIAPLLQNLERSRLLAAVLAFSLALLIGTVMAFRLVRPIRELMQIQQRFMAGERQIRYSNPGRDELHQLGLTFNELADRLEAEQQQQKRLIADVAHDLRTPLTILKGELEYLQDGVNEASPQVIDRLSEEANVLVHLVNDLRLLTLADSGSLQFNMTDQSLRQLTLDAAHAFTQLAQTRACQIVVEGNEVVIHADRDRIKQVLYNLLHNALMHTKRHSVILCSLECSAGWALLHIRDHGPGLPETALEHIFERLYRIDSTRNRRDGGSGLGLAIVKTLIEAHGGQVKASNHPQGGAVFTLSLPCAEQDRQAKATGY